MSSVGRTASAPYTRAKGVWPVARFGVVLIDQIEPPARHPLPWSTGQKKFSPRNSYTGHLECSFTMIMSKNDCGKMTQRSLRKIVFGRL